MITENELLTLLDKDESPILEFKREWYWNDSTHPSVIADKWGEFLKDLISLSNGYLNYVGKLRHLIFGYSETTQTIYDIELKNIRHLSNIKLFKKQLINKLESYTTPTFLNFEIQVVNIHGKDLLVFEIPSPFHITELKKELKTKTRSLDSGSILIRKGQNSAEVRTASPKEYQELSYEFNAYKTTKPDVHINNNEDTLKRSIAKTV